MENRSNPFCMEDKLSSTSIQQKINSKNAAYRKKLSNKENKLIDLLRQKCKIRVKNSRDSSFNNSRTFSEPEKECVKAFIWNELNNNIDTDINLQEIIYKELVDEIDNWVVNEMEREVENQINQYENNPIFCPVCQKFTLSANNVNITCSCGVKFLWMNTLENFHELILEKINDHGNSCNFNLQFYTEPVTIMELEDHHCLHALCESCAYYSLITD